VVSESRWSTSNAPAIVPAGVLVPGQPADPKRPGLIILEFGGPATAERVLGLAGEKVPKRRAAQGRQSAVSCLAEKQDQFGCLRVHSDCISHINEKALAYRCQLVVIRQNPGCLRLR